MQTQAKIPTRVVTIDVWRGKAYLPTLARYESGIYVDTEPVHIADLSLDVLASAIKTVKAAGHDILPDPKTREARKGSGVILKATGARSWKLLGKKGANYGISWAGEKVRIDMSRLDEKGRWQNDPNKVRFLPLDTPIEEIAAIILEDSKTRPEVFD